ncbi:STAS domain-containing protein [Neobacillus terrae]|uniref:STAS domain-containing protein n=1 Tax=Neobacillus terrae TaxID=3034837 RepID=UPI003082E36F
MLRCIIWGYLKCLIFCSKNFKSEVTSLSAKGSHKKVYHVTGQLFFASVTEFVNSFDFKEDIKEVEIDLSNAHLWDDSAVGAIDKVVIKYHQNAVKVTLKGLNTESNKLMNKIGIHYKPGGLEKVSGH